MQSISFIKQTVSEKKIFKDFFENVFFLGRQQPIKISNQDEGHLKRRTLLNKHFSKNKTQISPMRKQKFAISTFFYGTYKLPWQPEFLSDLNKNNFLVPPSCGSFGHTASEEMSFEIVDDDDGRTTDTYLSYKLTFEPSAQVS